MGYKIVSVSLTREQYDWIIRNYPYVNMSKFIRDLVTTHIEAKNLD